MLFLVKRTGRHGSCLRAVIQGLHRRSRDKANECAGTFDVLPRRDCFPDTGSFTLHHPGRLASKTQAGRS
jgi:hypothetical protein